MKVRSVKLRFLLTLYAFHKYTDEKHRLNSRKLNEFLAPYALDGEKAGILNTVKYLREFGVNVGYKGHWGTAGYWIADRPLTDEVIKQLVFVVRTNPNVSEEQAQNILDALKPLVTVYQEELLNVQD